MSPQPQHPLNCDNCTNDDCEFHDKPTTKCNFAKPFFAKKGCASHSSRTHTPLAIDPKKCFEEIVYSSALWKIYRQDAGMGEHDYAVFLNDVFFCRTEHAQHAHEIIRAIRFAANWRNGEQHDAAIRKDEREKVLDEAISAVESTNINDVEDARDAIESLRSSSEARE